MVESEILWKVLHITVIVLAFVFSFLAYTVGIRPQIQNIDKYTLGLIEGGIIVFVFTAPPLIYAYLAERKKSPKKS